MIAAALLLCTILPCPSTGQPDGGAAEASVRVVSRLARGDVDGAAEEACGMAEVLARSGDAGATRRALFMCSRLHRQQPVELLMALSQGACRGGSAEGVSWGISRLRAMRRGRELEAKAMAAAGMCGMEARKFGVAASAFQRSLELEPMQMDVAWHMALAGDYGGNWRMAAAAYRQWLLIQREEMQRVSSSENWVQVPRPRGKKVVAFLCIYRLESAEGGRWGPSSLGKVRVWSLGFRVRSIIAGKGEGLEFRV